MAAPASSTNSNNPLPVAKARKTRARRRSRTVPSQAAQDILAKVPRVVGCAFCFTNDGRHAMGGFGRRKRAFDEECGVSGSTLHDLRRTARSLMSRAGVPSDHAERCLGHVLPGVRGTYDRHEYVAEKRRAFAALAAQVERIVNPPAGNVCAS